MTHTIKQGETLWSISKKYYGDGKLWPVIYQDNQTLLNKSPHLIFSGLELSIPDFSHSMCVVPQKQKQLTTNTPSKTQVTAQIGQSYINPSSTEPVNEYNFNVPTYQAGNVLFPKVEIVEKKIFVNHFFIPPDVKIKMECKGSLDIYKKGSLENLKISKNNYEIEIKNEANKYRKDVTNLITEFGGSFKLGKSGKVKDFSIFSSWSTDYWEMKVSLPAAANAVCPTVKYEYETKNIKITQSFY